jgi:hypothetical protein
MDSSLLGLAWRSHIGDQQTSISNTNETAIVTAPGAAYADLYLLAIMNRSPSTDTDVTIRDGVGGTVRWKGTVKAGLQAGFALPPNGALKQATIGNAWTAQCSVGVSTVEITAAYVRIPER